MPAMPIEPGDLEIISTPTDVYGFNFYNPTTIAAAPAGSPIPFQAVATPDAAHTGFGPDWPIVPDALTARARRLPHALRRPAAADHHRGERRIVPRARLRHVADRRRRPHRVPRRATSPRSRRRGNRAFASTSTRSGRCSTTSSGPKDSPSDSDSCMSIMRPGRGRRRRRSTGIALSSRRQDDDPTARKVGARLAHPVHARVARDLDCAAHAHPAPPPAAAEHPRQRIRMDPGRGLVRPDPRVSGGLIAVFAVPLAGGLSDRTRGRWGRRRPWAVGGSLLTTASLVGMAYAKVPRRRCGLGGCVGRARRSRRRVHRSHRRPADHAAGCGVGIRQLLAGRRHRARRRRGGAPRPGAQRRLSPPRELHRRGGHGDRRAPSRPAADAMSPLPRGAACRSANVSPSSATAISPGCCQGDSRSTSATPSAPGCCCSSSCTGSSRTRRARRTSCCC